jgi:peptidoglycan L-alanyl-D-glutamate endopeptidase CwlK
MTYVLGKASLHSLVGVHSGLVAVTKAAITVTTQDFCVYEGLRTYAQQLENVKKGVSQTMDSMHLKGLAVDLVPWIDGKPVWDWGGCYHIAMAMDTAATQLGVANHIRWGGVWDQRLTNFGDVDDEQAYARAVEAYVKRHPGKDFLDGPHFEWRD